jgi:hypothetical protein
MIMGISYPKAVGTFNLALSYLDAADHLEQSLRKPSPSIHLAFEHPVRFLYAHTWELALKACLLRQGISQQDLKGQFGHKLTKIWDAIDRPRFPELRLDDRLRIIPEQLDRYHPSREYAYLVTGHKVDFTLSYVRTVSQRFRVPRATILDYFS